MNVTDNNRNGSRVVPIEFEEQAQTAVSDTSPLPTSESTGSETTGGSDRVPTHRFATRTDAKEIDGIGKNKLVVLGGGLAIAVVFFVFTAVVGKSPKKGINGKPSTQLARQEGTKQSKGSVTPVMETVRIAAPDNSSGQLGPNDIRRTRSSDGGAITNATSRPAKRLATTKPETLGSLGNVPSFADTQQKWEEPQPYGESVPLAMSQTQQQQNVLKEPSLVFVRSQVQNPVTAGTNIRSDGDSAPLLGMTPGTRIQAKLETQISSAVQAPIVAVVEYTYAIGDRIVLPAGARVYGQLQQADRSGLVSVKFDEIELLDGARERIDAIGTGLDLGPIKGNVFGKNTGKNFLVRAASGLGSVFAEIAGNNSGAAFTEDDMLRERLAENIGTAGDSEVMNLNANSRVVVSVPADTKIYIVFTKHEANSSELHTVSSATK
ncbi:TrbI/VirB10 family protein [Tunturiibacter psychrotolerans]|uniref:TrbI/VirB10 family protein n=1 Tax=Tunturiibacter psychrotolerans TaxID=3069686 RepID=UPI003D1F78B9